MSTAVAIFAKTIGLSQVKTRLAKSIGKNKAEEFYTLSVNAIEELMLNLSKQNEITPYWSLAEKEAVIHDSWTSFETMWTGEGDLGKRLFNVLDKLLKKHKQVIIIGTDSPQLESEIILKTVDKLNENPEGIIIGPAIDGGFYLFASSIEISKETWTNVEYSKEDTLSQLLSELDNKDIQYSFLKEMGDVDEIEDFKNLYNCLYLTEDTMTHSQERLFEYLKKVQIK